MTLTDEDIREIVRVIKTRQFGGITECDEKGNEKTIVWELKFDIFPYEGK